MGPRYAGMLGTLAFVVVVLRGAFHGDGLDGTVRIAILALCVFAMIGYGIGLIAESTVRHSIRTRFAKEFGLAQRNGKTETDRI